MSLELKEQCDCIDAMNLQLKEMNQYLDQKIWVRHSDGRQKRTIVLVTGKLSKNSRKIVNIIPLYCPFCGKKYTYVEHC